MKFIKPIPITAALLVSSNVPETDYAEWSNATTYAVGDRCISTTTHMVYESAAAGNTNHDPTTDNGTWWVAVSPTNRHKMFDRKIGTITEQSESISVTVQPGLTCNSLGLLDVTGEQVQVRVLKGATVLADKTFPLTDQRRCRGLWDWLFLPLRRKSLLIVEGLPAFGGTQVEVTISGSGTVKCGTFAAGRMVNIGKTKYGAQVGIRDYSLKTEDQWGNIDVVERVYSKTIECEILVENDDLDMAIDELAAVRATPVIYIADNMNGRFACMVAYGFFKRMSAGIEYPKYSLKNLYIESLT